jgi:hypothetical protein
MTKMLRGKDSDFKSGQSDWKNGILATLLNSSYSCDYRQLTHCFWASVAYLLSENDTTHIMRSDDYLME